ncbi:MAG: hypothetical protein ACPHL6_09630, partial [Rubripirellula sp.]
TSGSFASVWLPALMTAFRWANRENTIRARPANESPTHFHPNHVLQTTLHQQEFLKLSSAPLIRSVFILGLLLTITGCGTPFKRLHSARDLFANGDLEATRVALEKVGESHSRYSDPAELDLAIVELASGKPVDAERRLRTLRDKFDRTPKINGVKEFASMVSDDTALAFRPSGYEEVLIRSMLAVCSLAHDQLDAESYTLQAMAKQSELARNSKQRGILKADDIYQPIAFAPYLRGVLREATHRNYDDAERSYRLVSEVQPEFSPIGADIQRASVGSHSEPEHGVIYIIACTGRGPVLEETEAPTTTAAMQIASVMLQHLEAEKNEDGEEQPLHLPNLASVKVPKVTLPPSNIASVGVEVDGRPVGVTETITNIEQLAIKQVEAEMPWTIARAMVRRVAKDLAVAKASNSLGLDGMDGTLFRVAASTLWSGMENADTRCWSLLPREIQVLRLELPVGSHEFALSSLGWSEEVYQTSDPLTLNVVNGKNQYIIAIAPDEHIYTLAASKL